MSNRWAGEMRLHSLVVREAHVRNPLASGVRTLHLRGFDVESLGELMDCLPARAVSLRDLYDGNLALTCRSHRGCGRLRLEDGTHRTGEPGQEIVSIESIVLGERRDAAVRHVDIDRARLGMHDPDQLHAVTQPHMGLVVDLTPAVTGRSDLRDDVGSDFGISRDAPALRHLLGGEKAMSGSRTVSGSRSSQTPASEPISLPSLRGLMNFPISTPRFMTISPCSCPDAMVSQSTPRISSPRTPSLYSRSRSSAVSRFASVVVVVVIARSRACSVYNGLPSARACRSGAFSSYCEVTARYPRVTSSPLPRIGTEGSASRKTRRSRSP